MALPTFEQFQNGNTGGGNSKLPSFSTFLQTYEKPVKKETKVGKALSGVGNFGKEIAKDGINSVLVKPAARTTEALTRLLAPNSLAAKGYEAMANEGQSQKFAGMEVKPIKAFGQGGGKQIAGEALQAASWLYGGAEVKAGVKALTKTAELAAKKTFAEIAVKQIPELLKIGFVGSSAATIGNQLEKTAGTDEKIDWGQAAKDIALGTALTPVLGLAITKLFGTKAAKILEARQAIRDAEVVANKIKADAMPIGTPSANFMSESNRMLPAPRTPGEIPIELPGKGILQSAENLRNPVKQTENVVDKSPIVKKAEQFNSRNDFIKSEMTSNVLAKDINKNKFTKGKVAEIPKYTEKQLAKIWDDAHATPTEKGLPPLQPKTNSTPKTSFDPSTGKPIEPTPAPKTEVPPIEAPKVDTNTPEFKQKVKENFDTLNEKNPEEFNAKTHEVYANEFALEQTANPALAEAYATGRVPHPKGAAFNDAFNALLSNQAQKSGDAALIDRLSDSSLTSISGQKLEANKMRIKDSSVDLLKKVKQGKLEGLPKNIQKIIKKEAAAGKTEIDKAMLTFKPTPEITNKVLDSLICT